MNRIIWAGVVLAISAAAAIGQQGMSVRDFRKLVDLSSLNVSPDGKSVAFIRTVSDFDKDVKHSTLMIVSVNNGAAKALTDGIRTVGSPRWAPVGGKIAFVSQSSEKTDQVFVVPEAGGVTQQITHCKFGVQQYAWSPSGDRIAFVTQDEPVNAAALAKHDDLFDIHNVGFLSTAPSTPSHLWVIPAAGGNATRITSGKWSVLQTPAPFVGGAADPSWSSDGKRITFCRQENPDNSDGDLSRVAVVDVATKKVKELTNASTYEYEATFSPKGNTIAYLRPESRPLSAMYVWDSNDKVLTPNLDLAVSAFGFLPDGKHLIVQADKGIQTGLWSVGFGSSPQALTMGDLSVQEFAVGRSGRIAMVASGPSTAAEIYVYGSLTAKPTKITAFNRSFAKAPVGKCEELTWTGPDGEKSNAVVSYPVGYLRGQKYPVMVWLHGGPEAAATQGFAVNEIGPMRQVLTGKGFVVFEPNYRGSDNLGNAHEMAIFGDPSEGPASDVLAGIDELEKTVNIGPISIGGHSYGGHMTAWLASHDQRWKSAIVADGQLDWTTTYNMSNSGNLAWARDSLGGTPSDPASADLYRISSPLTYASQISTPTLIISGTADQQVPVVESYALYHALVDRKTPVRFVGIPGAEHSPSRPVQRERYYEIMVEWIVRHLPKPVD